MIRQETKHETKSVACDLKTVEANGTFSGYASRFGVADLGRDLVLPEVERGREVLALMRAGALDGLSIGFRTVEGRTDSKTGVRKLSKIDLWEISVVTFPMQPEARISAVKNFDAAQLAAKLRSAARQIHP